MQSKDFDDGEEAFADASEGCTFLSMKMNLKTIVMNGIESHDWVLDVLENKEVHVSDDLASDEGDMLDT